MSANVTFSGSRQNGEVAAPPPRLLPGVPLFFSRENGARRLLRGGEGGGSARSVSGTNSMSSNSIQARGYERSHRGFTSVFSVASSMFPKKISARPPAACGAVLFFRGDRGKFLCGVWLGGRVSPPFFRLFRPTCLCGVWLGAEVGGCFSAIS